MRVTGSCSARSRRTAGSSPMTSGALRSSSIRPTTAARIVAELGDRLVAAVVLTHGHFDHLGAVKALVAHTGAPLLVHAEDAESITTPVGSGGAAFGFDATAPPPDRLLARRGRRRCRESAPERPSHPRPHSGRHLPVRRWRRGPTPPALLGRHALRGQCGAYRLPGRRRPRALASRSPGSSRRFLPETVVHPGHGPDTTIGRERRLNPFFPRA